MPLGVCKVVDIVILHLRLHGSTISHVSPCLNICRIATCRTSLGSLGKIANPCEFEPQNLTRDSFIFVSWIEPAN